jgi:ectoine hydroxylase-related dioxygenase (phytanoyl-CoA dioxygenase family)
VVDALNNAFQPLLEETIRKEGPEGNRGPGRYYITPPFQLPWTQASIVDNEIIMAIVSELVGSDGVFCQLATDTPCQGSEYQDLHRDTQALFPEWGQETPPFQLAVNFPLVDCTLENGPLEMTLSTHRMDKDEALRRINAGDITIEPVLMKRGDILIRDVRHIHRGTPNRSGEPRPMAVLGYSRRWLFRPEVEIRLAKDVLESMPVRTQQWLRFNPVFKTAEDAEKKEENYRSFAY